MIFFIIIDCLNYIFAKDKILFKNIYVVKLIPKITLCAST